MTPHWFGPAHQALNCAHAKRESGVRRLLGWLLRGPGGRHAAATK